MTNFERIIKSPEALIDWFLNYCNAFEERHCTKYEKLGCRECLRDWLKQEAEDVPDNDVGKKQSNSTDNGK